MNAEMIRKAALALPHVVETMQFGDNLVLWVGDKALGGRMFCLVDLNMGFHGVCSFAAGDRFDALLEIEGMRSAPYLARAKWVAAEEWSVLRDSEWRELLAHAHATVLARLPKKTLAALNGAPEPLAKPRRQRKRPTA